MKSTRRKPIEKPVRPEGYPLFAHDNGRWAKKIRGRMVYFGAWAETRNGRLVRVKDMDASIQAAKDEYERQAERLKEGLPKLAADDSPGLADEPTTIKTLCNRFYRSKEAKLECGDLSERSFRDYTRTMKTLMDYFGKFRRVDSLTPNDFRLLRVSLSKRLGPTAIHNEINRTRSILKFGVEHRLIAAPFYGQEFSGPPQKKKQGARNAGEKLIFNRGEVLAILRALDGLPVEVEGKPKPVTLPADPAMKAMVLLALQAGLGNTDLSSLPESAIDLDSGWLDYPRSKTAIPRRVPLWGETTAAIRAAIAVRPIPAEPRYRGLVFLTSGGFPWCRVQEKQKRQKNDEGRIFVSIDSLSPKFGKIMNRLGINRNGRNMYCFRRLTETIGGKCRDQIATNAVMGHKDNTMAGVYRWEIDDDRLQAVTDTIRDWLWPPAPAAEPEPITVIGSTDGGADE
jgi:integrase